jgi:hypothetical protein
MTCQSSGTFAPRVICEPTSCEATSVAHSVAHGGSESIAGVTGDVVAVVCSAGYYGSAHVVCQPTGTFSSAVCLDVGTAVLSKSAAVGDNTLALAVGAGVSGIGLGEQVVIGKGSPTEEANVIVGINVSLVSLQHPLQFDHLPGTHVKVLPAFDADGRNGSQAAGVDGHNGTQSRDADRIPSAGAADDGQSQLSGGALAAVVVVAGACFAVLALVGGVALKNRTGGSSNGLREGAEASYDGTPFFPLGPSTPSTTSDGSKQRQQLQRRHPQKLEASAARKVEGSVGSDTPDVTVNPMFDDVVASSTSFEAATVVETPEPLVAGGGGGARASSGGPGGSDGGACVSGAGHSHGGDAGSRLSRPFYSLESGDMEVLSI